jgi:hypothetical protein
MRRSWHWREREAMTDLAAPHSPQPAPVARRSRPAMRAYTSNPVRIERIGTDHVQVFVRPASGDAELVLGVEHSRRSAASGNPTIRVDTR